MCFMYVTMSQLLCTRCKFTKPFIFIGQNIVVYGWALHGNVVLFLFVRGPNPKYEMKVFQANINN